MRTIKFRAWDKENKEMVYDDGDLAIFRVIKRMAYKSNHRTHEFMQSTGLHDKNGREIYEGDIVRLSAYCHRLVKVEYRGCTWKLIYPDGNAWGDLSAEWHKTKPEVIGNIYEKASEKEIG